MNRIIKGLYISDFIDANNPELLKEHGITAIVNVAIEMHDNVMVKMKQFKVGMFDAEGNSLDMYVLAGQLVLDLLRQGETVLVHCWAGKSRSYAVATVALGALNLQSERAQKPNYDVNSIVKPTLDQIEEARHEVYMLSAHKPMLASAISHVWSRTYNK